MRRKKSRSILKFTFFRAVVFDCVDVASEGGLDTAHPHGRSRLAGLQEVRHRRNGAVDLPAESQEGGDRGDRDHRKDDAVLRHRLTVLRAERQRIDVKAPEEVAEHAVFTSFHSLERAGGHGKTRARSARKTACSSSPEICEAFAALNDKLVPPKTLGTWPHAPMAQ